MEFGNEPRCVNGRAAHSGRTSRPLDRCIATFGRVLTGGKLPVLRFLSSNGKAPRTIRPGGKMKTSNVWTMCCSGNGYRHVGSLARANHPPTPEVEAARARRSRRAFGQNSSHLAFAPAPS